MEYRKSSEFFLLWWSKKQTSFKNICEQNCFPIPPSAPPSPNAHMPRFYWKSDKQNIWRKYSHTWKKPTCWLLQGEGMWSPDTSPCCLSLFNLSVCPLIRLLSLPSASYNTLYRKGWTALLENLTILIN